MKVYLYTFESSVDNLYLTNDNIDHVHSGITYHATSIESKEVVLDLKEIMGEVTLTMPWEQAGFLQDCVSYPYDAAVEARVYTYDTVWATSTLVFKGFVNTVKASQCQVELSCVSFVEQARDNFPRMYITRICNHRLYSPLCTLDPNNWMDHGTIHSITNNRLGFYVSGVTINREENWFRYGYVAKDVPHRWVTYSSPIQAVFYGGETINLMLFNVMHPIPYTWAPGMLIDMVAGCDKRIDTCKNKFGNFVHYLGFPHAPYETIRLTGLKSTEVYQREGDGKK